MDLNFTKIDTAKHALLLGAVNALYLSLWNLWVLEYLPVDVIWKTVHQFILVFAPLFAVCALAARPWKQASRAGYLKRLVLAALVFWTIVFLYFAAVYLVFSPASRGGPGEAAVPAATLTAGAALLLALQLLIRRNPKPASASEPDRAPATGFALLLAWPLLMTFPPALFMLYHGAGAGLAYLVLIAGSMLAAGGIPALFLVMLARARPRWAFAPALLPVALLLILILPKAAIPEIGAGDKDRFPDVYIISVDTLRQDALGCYGHDPTLTPAIDGIAEDGILFEKAYAPSPWTMTSLGTMLSGLYPSVHQAGRIGDSRENKRALSERVVRLPQVLKSAGYETAAFVKNPLLDPIFKYNAGFDIYEFMDQRSYFLEKRKKYVFLPANAASLAADAIRIARDRPGLDFSQGYISYLHQPSDRPVFVWIHFLEPHLPYEFHPELGDFYAGMDKKDMAYADLQMGDVRRRLVASPGFPKGLRRLYDGEVAVADRRVGEILDALKYRGRYNDALLIFTADHGEEFNDHGWFEHGHSHYNELIHVPLIVKLPGGERSGTRHKTAVGLVDIFPTVLDLLGLDYDGPLQGRSLAPAPDGEDNIFYPSEKRLYGSPTQIAVIAGRYKLIMEPGGGETMLFDLTDDPAETRNLAGERPQIVERLAGLLEKWAADCGKLNRLVIGDNVEGPVNVSREQEKELRALGYIQ